MLGTRIADLRVRLGWSQAQLARRLNISPSAVGMYEQGRREPSANMLLALSRTLDVSVEYLLTGCLPSREDTFGQMKPGKRAGEEQSLMESLRALSREELLVLLTAELIGTDCDDA